MIRFIRKITTRLAAGTAVALVLAANPIGAFASPASLFIDHNGFNLNENSGWSHSVAVSNGQFVQLYVEVQTQPGMDAVQNLTVKIDLPSGGGKSTATVSTSKAGVDSRSDSVSFDYRGGTNCKLIYEPGSTGVRLDRNRDGTPDHDGPWSSDAIASGGINLGDFGTGPAGGLAQLSIKAKVECGTAVTTTKGGVTTQPATGLGVLPLALTFGAGTLGLALSRYGKGQAFKKREDGLAEVAQSLVHGRQARIKA